MMLNSYYYQLLLLLFHFNFSMARVNSWEYLNNFPLLVPETVRHHPLVGQGHIQAADFLGLNVRVEDDD